MARLILSRNNLCGKRLSIRAKHNVLCSTHTNRTSTNPKNYSSWYVSGVLWIIEIHIKPNRKDRNAERGDRKEFSKALKDLTDSNRTIATATETAAKKRQSVMAISQNYRLNQNLNQSSEEVEKIRLEFLSAVSNIDEQHVKRHVVDKEEVKLKEIA